MRHHIPSRHDVFPSRAGAHLREAGVNGPVGVFAARRGRRKLSMTILGAGQLADLVKRMLHTSGRWIDMSTPFVDAMMPDGSRLHVVIPDMTHAEAADLPERAHWRLDLQQPPLAGVGK